MTHPSEACTCRGYWVRFLGEPEIPAMSEAEPDPLCAVHFPPRWKVACINWTSPDAPRATTYLLIGGAAEATRYHPTWADAIQWLTDHASILKPLADAQLMIAVAATQEQLEGT